MADDFTECLVSYHGVAGLPQYDGLWSTRILTANFATPVAKPLVPRSYTYIV